MRERAHEDPKQIVVRRAAADDNFNEASFKRFAAGGMQRGAATLHGSGPMIF